MRGDRHGRLDRTLVPVVTVVGTVVGAAATVAGLTLQGRLAGLVIAAATIAVVALVLAAVLSRRAGPEGILAVYEGVLDPPWSDLFADSREVEIVTRFCPAVFEESGEALVAFFARGGTMTLAVPDCQDRSAVDVMARQHTAFDVFPHDLTERVAMTLAMASNICARASGDAGAVTVLTLDFPPNYAAYCFDRRRLVLLPYEHSRREGIRAPRLLVDLDRSEPYRRFWDHESRELRRIGAERTVPEALALVQRAGEPQS